MLDGHRRIGNPQDTRPFTGSRAHPTGELREIVGLVETFQGLAPEAAIDQVIPFRDQVVDWAARGHATDQRAGVTERDTAVHAAACLILKLEHWEMIVELMPIVHPFER